MSKTKIIIFGGKGTAVNLAECIYDAEQKGMPVHFLGFAFDDTSFGTEVNGFPILCKTTEAYKLYKDEEDVKFIFQMNHQNKMAERLKLIESYQIPEKKWYSFIHPTSYVAKSVKIGCGCAIFPNCTILSNVKIGNHTTICASTTIGHDTIIGKHNFMATHVCVGSYVNTKNNIFFAQNVTIRGRVSIEENNLIGLGSSVVKNIIEKDGVYLGTPAKFFQKLNNTIL